MADKTPSSRASIAALHARGWTDSAIGRAIGRNSSLVHQVATGHKPGRNLSGSLAALNASGAAAPETARQAPSAAGKLPEAPRRQTATGQPARVRTSTKPQPRAGRASRQPTAAPISPRTGKPRTPGGARQLPNGQHRVDGSSKAVARFVAGLTSNLSDNARIKLAIMDTRGKWHTLGQKGGITPAMLREIMKGRTWKEALAYLLALFYPAQAAAGTLPVPTGETQFYILR